MPNPAPENLMLDALQVELEKIGTAPTTNWNTDEVPALKIGVPGDPIPGPNRMSMWLQHIGTEFLDAEGGTSTHRIRAMFAVWCASSHAPDAGVRALNLANDVRRVLFAAESTFAALFDGGIWPGECTDHSREATPRSGICLVSQQYQIVATVLHDGSLALDPSFMSLELEKMLLRIHSFDVLPTIERVDGAFMQQRLLAPALVLETTGAGANKIAETRIEQNIDTIADVFAGRMGDHWSCFKTEIACTIKPGIVLTASPTTFVGVEIGTHNQSPPFPASPTNAVAQLRWAYQLQQWQLMSAAGDGTAASIVPLVIPSGSLQNLNGSARVRLLYDPYTQKIQAFVNNVLGAEISDVSKLPMYRDFNASFLKIGAFATTGTGAGTFSANFAACHCKTYNPTLPAAVLWY